MNPDHLKENRFWALNVSEVARLLETHPESGISAQEAKRRLALFGKNSIEISGTASSVSIFLSQLKSPLILVLICAGVVTLSIGDYKDAVFIFIAVLVNSVLGFYQESKADRVLTELKTYLKQRARVIREGIEKEISADELVPGDLVRLSQGDRVSADVRIVFTNDFQVDESVLTGESLPVMKSAEAVKQDVSVADQLSMAFAGTLVTQGVATALVCRTDAQTEFGKIAAMVASSEGEKTPLQKAILDFSIKISGFLGVMTFAVFVIGVSLGVPVLEMFLTAVAIAVSAIPEGLPISMTVILAVGVERMARRKGVVRKLVAAEALGSTTVILTDKTGTLTLAQMKLSQVLPVRADEKQMFVRALGNTSVLIENPTDEPQAWRISGKIMEVALARAAAIRGLSLDEITAKKHILQSIPFNAIQKFSVSLIREHGRRLLVYWGAPDILLSHADVGSQERADIALRIETLASKGERVLGLAVKEVLHPEQIALNKEVPLGHLSFEGLFTFKDPLRPHMSEIIARVHEAGIRTIIMTGDHKGTAVSVAHELGLETSDTSVLDASELRGLSEKELVGRLASLSVITRVTPFDKLRMVKAYQSIGETVAMTGDGVNDAPSIKQADIGVAMGSGTEVAQSVADLVLLDDNFETIVAAIEEGRRILGNIRKVLVYLLSNSADSIMLIGGALVFGLPLPLNALQILWVNFFADSFPAIAFGFEKEDDSLLMRPQKASEGLFDPLMRFLVLVIGLSTSALLFLVYYVLLRAGFEPALVRTFIFAAFGTYTLAVALPVRSLEKSIVSYSFFSNSYLTAGIGVGVVLMALAIYSPMLQGFFGTVPLDAPWLLGVLAISGLNILLIEFAKWLFRRKR